MCHKIHKARFPKRKPAVPHPSLHDPRNVSPPPPRDAGPGGSLSAVGPSSALQAGSFPDSVPWPPVAPRSRRDDPDCLQMLPPAPREGADWSPAERCWASGAWPWPPSRGPSSSQRACHAFCRGSWQLSPQLRPGAFAALMAQLSRSRPHHGVWARECLTSAHSAPLLHTWPLCTASLPPASMSLPLTQTPRERPQTRAG